MSARVDGNVPVVRVELGPVWRPNATTIVAPTCTKLDVAPGVVLELHHPEGAITDVVLVKNGKQLWLSPGEAIALQRGLWRAMVETSR